MSLCRWVFSIVVSIAVCIVFGVEQTVLASENRAQDRKDAWRIVEEITTALPDGSSLFKSWHNGGDIFKKHSSVAFEHGKSPMQSSEPQIVIFTHYNDIAYRHILRHTLNRPAELDQMRLQPPNESSMVIPVFPDGSEVLLTAWWPVAADQLTALPVWDPEQNPSLKDGNSYITWKRVVAVDCCTNQNPANGMDQINFVGRSFPQAKRISINAFQHVEVDTLMVDSLMQNRLARKAAVIALGRKLQAGDYLVLVAMHIAAKRTGSWGFATMWWHDHPELGPYAKYRPDSVKGAWHNYLLDAVFESGPMDSGNSAQLPCFNPWLEARFPDMGGGGGTDSNCIACHQRASFPAVSFLPVSQVAPDSEHDPAYAPGQLSTDFLWSIARQQEPELSGK